MSLFALYLKNRCRKPDGKHTMSKHMQLTIEIRPYYKNGLESVYPRIAEMLRPVCKSGTELQYSLFEIVGKLDRILYELEGNQPHRKIVLEHRKRLQELHEETEALIADWKLAEADQRLYRVEDIFDDMERELGVL